MRKFITYITCAIAAVLAAGCIRVDLNHVEDSAVNATLVLRNSDLMVTRATEDGIPGLNENLIANVQCFFSADGSSIDYATGLLTVGHSDVDENGVKIALQIPAEKLPEIFPNNAPSCTVYVLANAAEITNKPATIKAVKATEITLNTSKAVQDSFVMDGTSTINKTSTGLNGEISLVRAAAKIQVSINVADELTVNGATWTPNLDEITLKYNQSVTKSLVNAEAGDAKAWSDLTHGPDQPFYSYPSDWSDSKDHEATITLDIPWTIKGQDAQMTYRYQFPVNYDGKKLDRNNIYKITLNVGVLGGLVDPINLDPSYVVVDWNTNTVSAELSRPKYLVVDNHKYVMNNETYLEIPFHTSDPCSIVSYSCTQNHLTTSSNPANPTFDADADGSTNREYVIKIEDGNIVVRHGLNNNLSDNTANDSNGRFDFTPYNITFTIQHTGDATFKETVTITQYPAVFGETKVNSGGSTNKGYVFVNGYVGSPSGSDSDGSVQGFCAVSGSASGSGVSSNSMTVVTATSLQGTNYIIGDPRTTTINNLNTNWNWLDSPALYGDSSRELTYYYPAQRDLSLGANHPTYNMIAPKFRICSGYGAINANMNNRQYLEYMEGRCASYQEDGYPAGRWRLPTRAELEFVNTLCERQLLPDLFADIPYWTAHGYGRYQNGTFSVTASANRGSTDVSVRCVYDEWYWGSEPIANKGTFTWGDEPR